MSSSSVARHSAPSKAPKSDIAPTFDKALLGLLQASSLACIVLDAAKKIQNWNESAERLLGWHATEARERPFSWLLVPGEECDPLESTDSFPLHSPCRLRTKNKDVVEVKIQTAPLPGDSTQGSSHILLLQDLTETKFLEEALLHASDREQRRIGQELHDHLCQHLLGAAFAAKALAGALDREQSASAPQLHELARLINDSVFQVRDLSRGLHPVELDAAGLMSALQELANRAGHSKPCAFRCDHHVLVKSNQAALNAYRIAQEAVTAALLHTQAKKIEMSLSQSENRIRLEIFDDGKKEGVITANPTGIETKTLQYRAQAMKATLTMHFDPAEGTRVTCIFPA